MLCHIACNLTGSCLPCPYTDKICLATGASVEKLGEAAACAVKRINLDMRMAYAARKAGAELREEFEVVAADFNKQQGLWTVSSSSVSLLPCPALDAIIEHISELQVLVNAQSACGQPNHMLLLIV